MSLHSTKNSSLKIKSLKDSDYIGIFYCFFSFGTILFIILFFTGWAFALANLRNRNTVSHMWTLASCRSPDIFRADPDYHSGSRAKSVFSDSPHYLQNL